MTRAIDISDALEIQPWGHGIRLVRPDLIMQASNNISRQQCHSVRTILDLPFNVFFMDGNGICRNANLSTAHTMGCSSIRETIGISVSDVADKETAIKVRQHDRGVINTKRLQILNEDATFKNDNTIYQFLSIKFPWYDLNDNIIGIFGFSSIIQDQLLSQMLNQIYNLGLFDRTTTSKSNNPYHFELKDLKLTKREKQCVFYMIRGKSAKQVAEILNVSPRTIEHYCEILKTKMNVNSKSELIEKVIEGFWQNSDLSSHTEQ